MDLKETSFSNLQAVDLVAAREFGVLLLRSNLAWLKSQGLPMRANHV